jgi:hypothetical protein
VPEDLRGALLAEQQREDGGLARARHHRRRQGGRDPGRRRSRRGRDGSGNRCGVSHDLLLVLDEPRPHEPRGDLGILLGESGQALREHRQPPVRQQRARVELCGDLPLDFLDGPRQLLQQRRVVDRIGVDDGAPQERPADQEERRETEDENDQPRSP